MEILYQAKKVLLGSGEWTGEKMIRKFVRKSYLNVYRHDGNLKELKQFLEDNFKDLTDFEVFKSTKDGHFFCSRVRCEAGKDAGEMRFQHIKVGDIIVSPFGMHTGEIRILGEFRKDYYPEFKEMRVRK